MRRSVAFYSETIMCIFLSLVIIQAFQTDLDCWKRYRLQTFLTKLWPSETWRISVLFKFVISVALLALGIVFLSSFGQWSTHILEFPPAEFSPLFLHILKPAAGGKISPAFFMQNLEFPPPVEFPPCFCTFCNKGGNSRIWVDYWHNGNPYRTGAKLNLHRNSNDAKPRKN